MSITLALIAHDNKKEAIVKLASRYRQILSRYHLIATNTTGQRIQAETGLEIECMVSGPLGGDTQIAAKIVNGEVAAVIFLIDPLYAQPHEPDIQALLRVCEVYDVPLATNLATAEFVLQGLGKRRIAHLIFNPIAGQGNPDRDLTFIRQLLEPQIQVEVVITQPDTPQVEQAKAAIAKIESLESKEKSEHFIIASGGDGTISAVAGVTIGTGIPLGVIPRGTANAFATALGIPANVKGACETIVRGNTRIIDAAKCNDIPMILLAGLGFEAGMVDKTSRDLKNQLGTLAYVLAGVQQIAAQETFKATIEIEGKLSEFETPAITIANTAPATSVLAQGFGQVIPDDGLLEVTISTSKTRLEGIDTLMSLFTSALVKSQIERENLICLRVERIKIQTDPPQKLVVDGEIIEVNPVEFSCIPKGLTVFSPFVSP
ncbi:MAG: methylglyoxal synthase [Cyanobacteria bacterium SBLK]|nr:methylglyoxal synthase [Cyanobacteria bacterium SBLK]